MNHFFIMMFNFSLQVARDLVDQNKSLKQKYPSLSINSIFNYG